MEENHQEIKKEEIKQANKTLYLSLVVIAILVVALFTNGFGLFNKDKNPIATSLAIGDSLVLGSVDAKVTVYEFSDFSCPFCAAVNDENSEVIASLKNGYPGWEAPVPAIIEDYVNSGKVKMVFKYYPGHGQGKAAMLVGYALNEQNSSLFWKFHDLAFANQADTGDIIKMKAIAQELGANMTKLNEDVDSGKFNLKINEDVAMAQRNGVSGTPTFFVNGRTVSESTSSFNLVIFAPN